MKRISIITMIMILSIVFVGAVDAKEVDLDSVATLNATIGGSEKEIIQTTSTGTYKYYFKYVKIDDNEFKSYLSSKYVVDNSNDSTSEYAAAATKVADFEKKFKELIPTVNSTSDTAGWTAVTNNEIPLTGLTYENGKHTGYVLAVMAIRDGSSDVYITRNIYESKSATTLGGINFTDQDKATYGSSTTTTTTTTTTTDTTQTVDTVTEQNPETGLSDMAIYLVPASIVLGSALMFRRRYA